MYPTRRYGAAVRVNLIAMRPLLSPTRPSSLRQDLERRILAGERISGPNIIRARGTLKPGRPRRPADQPARMAA